MPAIWAALTAVLSNLVRTRIGFWIASLLLSFGIGIVAQKFAVDPAMSAIQSAANGLGGDLLAWFAYLQCDKFITIVVTAYSVAASLNGLRLRRTAA